LVTLQENQLLKDRNKSRRKRPCQGEKHLSVTSNTSVPSKEPGSDGHPVIDIQNTHKLEATKGPSLKRNTSTNINYGKGGLPPSKPARQKRRPGDLQMLISPRVSKMYCSLSNLHLSCEKSHTP